MTPSGAWTRRGALDVNARLAAEGLAHGVTTRAMGSMKSAENRINALNAAGLGGRRLFFCKQTHETKIVRPPFEGIPEADGLISDRAVIGVFMADCMPIFIWEPGGSYGVFHSGWRGTALGMPGAAVKAFGGDPSRLKVSIAAHIGPCCFQAREDCTSKFPTTSVVRRDGSTYVDLFADALRQLREAGVTDEPPRPACTACSPEDYFSFRRDKVGNSLFAFVGRRA